VESTDRRTVETARVQTVAQVAKAMGVSERAIYDAKRIDAEAPELAEAVRAGRMTIGTAKRRLRERAGSEQTGAQLRRAGQADMLAMRLMRVEDDWLTEDRIQRLVDLWVKYGDG
jgi:hypothetical protein